MRQVTLEHGLFLAMSENKKLYSDGLEPDEYICYEQNKGFCYEDGCLISTDITDAITTLVDLRWVKTARFYVE